MTDAERRRRRRRARQNRFNLSKPRSEGRREPLLRPDASQGPGTIQPISRPSPPPRDYNVAAPSGAGGGYQGNTSADPTPGNTADTGFGGYQGYTGSVTGPTAAGTARSRAETRRIARRAARAARAERAQERRYREWINEDAHEMLESALEEGDPDAVAGTLEHLEHLDSPEALQEARNRDAAQIRNANLRRIAREHFVTNKDGEIVTETVRQPTVSQEAVNRRMTEVAEDMAESGASRKQALRAAERAGKRMVRRSTEPVEVPKIKTSPAEVAEAIRDVNEITRDIRRGDQTSPQEILRWIKDSQGEPGFIERAVDDAAGAVGGFLGRGAEGTIESFSRTINAPNEAAAGLVAAGSAGQRQPQARHGAIHTGLSAGMEYITRPGLAVEQIVAKALAEAGAADDDPKLKRRLERANPIEAILHGHKDEEVVEGADIAEALGASRNVGLLIDIVTDPTMYVGFAGLPARLGERSTALITRIRAAKPELLDNGDFTVRFRQAAESGDFRSLETSLSEIAQENGISTFRLGKTRADKRAAEELEQIRLQRMRSTHETAIEGRDRAPTVQGENIYVADIPAVDQVIATARYGLQRELAPGFRLRLMSPLGHEWAHIRVPIPAKLAEQRVLPRFMLLGDVLQTQRTGLLGTQRSQQLHADLRVENAAEYERLVDEASKGGQKERARLAEFEQDLYDKSIARSIDENLGNTNRTSLSEFITHLNARRFQHEIVRVSNQMGRNTQQAFDYHVLRAVDPIKSDERALARVQMAQFELADRGTTSIIDSLGGLSGRERLVMENLEKVYKQMETHGYNIKALRRSVAHYSPRTWTEGGNYMQGLRGGTPLSEDLDRPLGGARGGTAAFQTGRAFPEMAAIANRTQLARAIKWISRREGGLPSHEALKLADQWYRTGRIRLTSEILARQVNRGRVINEADLSDLEREAYTSSQRWRNQGEDVEPLFKELERTEGILKLTEAAYRGEAHGGHNLIEDPFGSLSGESEIAARLAATRKDIQAVEEALEAADGKLAANYEHTLARLREEADELRLEWAGLRGIDETKIPTRPPEQKPKKLKPKKTKPKKGKGKKKAVPKKRLIIEETEDTAIAVEARRHAPHWKQLDARGGRYLLRQDPQYSWFVERVKEPGVGTRWVATQIESTSGRIVKSIDEKFLRMKDAKNAARKEMRKQMRVDKKVALPGAKAEAQAARDAAKELREPRFRVVEISKATDRVKKIIQGNFKSEDEALMFMDTLGKTDRAASRIAVQQDGKAMIAAERAKKGGKTPTDEEIEDIAARERLTRSENPKDEIERLEQEVLLSQGRVDDLRAAIAGGEQRWSIVAKDRSGNIVEHLVQGVTDRERAENIWSSLIDDAAETNRLPEGGFFDVERDTVAEGVLRKSLTYDFKEAAKNAELALDNLERARKEYDRLVREGAPEGFTPVPKDTGALHGPEPRPEPIYTESKPVLDETPADRETREMEQAADQVEPPTEVIRDAPPAPEENPVNLPKASEVGVASDEEILEFIPDASEEYVGTLRDFRDQNRGLFPVLDPRVSNFYRTSAQGLQTVFRARWQAFDRVVGRDISESARSRYVLKDGRQGNTGEIRPIQRPGDDMPTGYAFRETGEEIPLDQIDFPDRTLIPNKNRDIWFDPHSGREYVSPAQLDNQVGQIIADTVGPHRLWPSDAMVDARAEFLRMGEYSSKTLYDMGLDSAFSRVMAQIRMGVTTYFPAYHVRNLISDTIKTLQADTGIMFSPKFYVKTLPMTVIGGMTRGRIRVKIPYKKEPVVIKIGSQDVSGTGVKGAAKRAAFAIDVPGLGKMNMEDMLFMMDYMGLRSSQHLAEVAHIADKGNVEHFVKWFGTQDDALHMRAFGRPLQRLGQSARGGFGLGSSRVIGRNLVELSARREDIVRMWTFLQRMKRNNGDAADAMWYTVKHHFDYADLTLKERRIARNLFLFYTWYRKNIPLQFMEMISRPGFFSAIANGYIALQQGETPLNRDWSTIHPSLPDMSGKLPHPGLIPDYMVEQLAAPTMNWNGHSLAVGFGSPLADLNLFGQLLRDGPFVHANEFARQALGMANPLISLPYLLAFRKDILTGRDLKNQESSGLASLVNMVTSKFGLNLNTDEEGQPMLPFAVNLIGNILPFVGRGSGYFRSASEYEDQGRIAKWFGGGIGSFLTGLNVVMSPARGERLHGAYLSLVAGRAAQRSEYAAQIENEDERDEARLMAEFDEETLRWADSMGINRRYLQVVTGIGPMYITEDERFKIDPLIDGDFGDPDQGGVGFGTDFDSSDPFGGLNLYEDKSKPEKDRSVVEEAFDKFFNAPGRRPLPEEDDNDSIGGLEIGGYGADGGYGGVAPEPLTPEQLSVMERRLEANATAFRRAREAREGAGEVDRQIVQREYNGRYMFDRESRGTGTLRRGEGPNADGVPGWTVDLRRPLGQEIQPGAQERQRPDDQGNLPKYSKKELREFIRTGKANLKDDEVIGKGGKYEDFTFKQSKNGRLRVMTYKGQDLVGAPHFADVARARARGELKEQNGMWTTPEVRQVLKQLKKVRGVSWNELIERIGEVPEAADLPPLPKEAAKAIRSASKEYGVPESLLTAIYDIESRFGELVDVTSYAGAIGHMQFMPATWEAYGVDADRSGEADPYDFQDAMHGAANYLRASFDESGNWYDAIFAYNHADWYVAEVQHAQRQYAQVWKSAAIKPIPKPLAKRAKALGIDPTRPLRRAAEALGVDPKAFRPRYDADEIVHLPGTEADAGVRGDIAPLVNVMRKKFDWEITAAYDPDGSHKSSGHNETGTALDIVPASGDWGGKFAQGLAFMTSMGFEVLYDGQYGTMAYVNHGEGNHAHVEFLVADGTQPGSRKRARKALISGRMPALPAGLSTDPLGSAGSYAAGGGGGGYFGGTAAGGGGGSVLPPGAVGGKNSVFGSGSIGQMLKGIGTGAVAGTDDISLGSGPFLTADQASSLGGEGPASEGTDIVRAVDRVLAQVDVRAAFPKRKPYRIPTLS
jgi:hypothetical protein